ncbi:hypothetical protein C8J57DRAFT_1254207 [Mycena rebaudengoi]|nr:hypothetical protein C8J57DRAFT_1254207 [Mycena rebaudengoi]
MGDEVVAEAHTMQADLLGKEDECGQDKPVLNEQGNLTGGNLFERSFHSQHINGAIYLWAKLPHTASTCPNSAGPGRSHQLPARRSLGEFNVSAMQTNISAPQLNSYEDDLASIRDVSLKGSSCKQKYITFGLSHALYVLPHAEATSIKGLGGFGSPHIDKGDSLGRLSTLVPHSKLEEGVHPGPIFLLWLGVARELWPLHAIYMCRLHPHGGTSPTYPESFKLLRSDNVCSLTIAYIPCTVFDGKRMPALAVLLSGAVLTVPHEACGVHSGLAENIPVSNQAMYTVDRLSLMDQRSLANYICQDHFHFKQMVLRQVTGIAFFIDCDAELTSTYYLDETGKHVRVEP